MNFKNSLIFLSALISTSVFADTLTLNSIDKTSTINLLKGNTMVAGPGIYIKNKFVPNILKISFLPDGTLKGAMATAASGIPQTDTGNWVVKEDGSFCTTWKSWGDFCQFVYPLKDHYVVVTTDQTKIVTIPKENFVKGIN